jgi:protein-S-isoprenylcysteine O-methyltransferase Ste14
VSTSVPPTIDIGERPRTRKKRLLVPKLLFLPMIAFAALSQSVYADGGFWDTTLEVVSFLLLLVGAIGRVWVAAYISGRKTVELVTDGPYSITRNPLYFFSFIAYLGAGLAFEKVSIAIAFGVFFFLTHWTTILTEERKLGDLFGTDFDDYAVLVPRFLPRPQLIAMPEFVTFRTASFNLAILDGASIMMVFVLAHLIEYGQNAGVVPMLFRRIP